MSVPETDLADALHTLAAYARHRGCSRTAVLEAIRGGRLKACVVYRGGRAWIRDVELADREWAANTWRPDRSAPVRAVEAQERAAAATAAVAAHDPEANAAHAAMAELGRRYQEGRTQRQEAAIRREEALAELARMELDKRKGQLVEVDSVRQMVHAAFTVVRTKLLALPARVKTQLPHLSTEEVRLIDELVREALDDLANEGTKGGR